MKDRMLPTVAEHDFGVLNALGDPRMESAARLFSLSAVGVELNTESVDEQQEQLAAVMDENQVCPDDIDAIIDWHIRMSAPYTPKGFEELPDFWTLVERDHREGATSEKGRAEELPNRADEMLALWTLKCQLRYHKLRYGNKT